MLVFFFFKYLLFVLSSPRHVSAWMNINLRQHSVVTECSLCCALLIDQPDYIESITTLTWSWPFDYLAFLYPSCTRAREFLRSYGARLLLHMSKTNDTTADPQPQYSEATTAFALVRQFTSFILRNPPFSSEVPKDADPEDVFTVEASRAPELCQVGRALLNICASEASCERTLYIRMVVWYW